MKGIEKRILLPLLLFSALCVSAFASQTELTIHAEALPAVGESFTVTVDISGNPGVCSAQLTLGYDKSVVSCESISASGVLGGMLSATNPNAASGAIVACADTKESVGDGTMCTCTFLVLKEGDPAFTLLDATLTDGEGTHIVTNVPEKRVEQKKDSEKQESSSGDSSGGSSSGGGQSAAASENTAAAKTEEIDTATLFNGQRFSDVPEKHWSYLYVNKAASLGLVDGMADGSFAPDRSMTRAEFVTMLWRLAGKPQAKETAAFTDLKLSWYRGAVSWAAEKGFVNGTGGTLFSPNAPLSRQELITMLFRYNGGVNGMETMLGAFGIDNLSAFTDAGQVASWARNAVEWALFQSLLTGTSVNTLSPTATATRAQAAAIFVRYVYMTTKTA